jgi:hypothetical protein
MQAFLAEGLQRTTAGLGSVIIDSQPLSVAVLAALLFGEALSPLGIAGLFIGVAGLLLELPQDVLQHSTSALQSGGLSAGLGALQQGLQSGVAAAGGDGGGWKLTDSGEFWMLLAAQSMAVGTVMVRWVTLLAMSCLSVGLLCASRGCADASTHLQRWLWRLCALQCQCPIQRRICTRRVILRMPLSHPGPDCGHCCAVLCAVLYAVCCTGGSASTVTLLPPLLGTWCSAASC